MSSLMPGVPHILYCSIPDENEDIKAELLQSNSLEAVLVRLMATNGTLRTVSYKDHIQYPQVYVIQLECMWPGENPRAILDSKQGVMTLRNTGLDVAIQTKKRDGYWFVILNPFRVVYRVLFSSTSSSPVIIASRSDMDPSRYRGRAKNDPREPQEEVDALLLKLNRSRNPLDELSVDKVAASHQADVAWAKDQIVDVFRRVWSENVRSDQTDCWRCVLAKGESSDEMCLRVLFWSFGRKPPKIENGLKAEHFRSDLSREDKTMTCVRPSHLHLTSAIDPQAVQKTAESLTNLLAQMQLS